MENTTTIFPNDRPEWVMLELKKYDSISKKYQLILEKKRIKFTNIIVSCGLIKNDNDEIIHRIDRVPESDAIGHTWIQITPDDERLIYSQQSRSITILSMNDLTEHKITPYYSWESMKTSPSGYMVAVVCSRDSEKPIRVFDLRTPSGKTYPEVLLSKLPSIKGMDPYIAEVEWLNDTSLKLSVMVDQKNDPLAFNKSFCSKDIILSVGGQISNMSQITNHKSHH